MKRLKHILTFLFITLIISNFTSCFVLKKISRKKITNSLDTAAIIKKIVSNKPKFNIYTAKFRGVYTDKYNQQDFIGSIKIYNDSLIIMSLNSSLGFSIGKLYLYKDTIKLKSLFIQNNGFTYKQINSTYGVSLNLPIVQNLLLDNFFTYPGNFSIDKYKLNLLNDTLAKLSYRKPLKVNNKLSEFKDEMLINLNYLKIIAHNIWDFRNTYTEFYINYRDFIKVKNYVLPSKINVTVINSDTLYLKLNLKKITIE